MVFGTLMHIDDFNHDAYKDACVEDEDFRKVYQ